MDVGAMKLIQESAVNAAGVRMIHPEAEPGHVYYIARAGDPLDRRTAEPPPRIYVALTVADFGEMVLRHLSAPLEGPLEQTKRGPTLVMIGKDRIVAILNETERRERIIFNLDRTEQAVVLQSCAEQRRFLPQNEFVNMLRIGLTGGVPSEIVQAFRNLRFSKNSEGESSISNSGKGVSSKLQMELAAGGRDIPEEISVRVALYEQFAGFLEVLRCAVIIDPVEPRFALIPLAGEMQRLRTITWKAITGELRQTFAGSDIRVFCAEPN